MTSIFKGKYLTDLLNMIKSFNTAKELIEKGIDESEQGFVYEALWDVVLTFGIGFLNRNEYKNMKGNVNTRSLKSIKNYEKYFNETSIISGNAGGVSDITPSKKDKK